MGTNSNITSIWGEIPFPTSKLADIFHFQKTVNPAYTILQGPQKLSTLMRSPPDLSFTLELLRKIPHSFSFYIALLVIPLFLHTFYQAYATPLRHVPGPWIAKFTRLWLLRAINSREYQRVNVDLHRKYGPVVRISPNEYSIDDPDASTVIYRSRDQLIKAPRYSSWGLPTAEANIFTSRSIDHNAARRRQIAPLYQLSALTNIEHQVDLASASLLSKFSTFACHGRPIDLCQWIQYYAFDTIGALTFGKPLGFLDQGEDVADVISTIHTYSRYGGVMGVFNELHPYIFRFLQLMAPKGEVGIAAIYAFAAKRIAEWNCRSENEKTLSVEQNEGGEVLKTDYLTSLLAKHRRTPESFSVDDAFYHIISNVVAGGETTGIALTAAMYLLVKSPRVLDKLRGELEGIKRSENGRVGVMAAQDCGYLSAVIKEVLRLFPPAGLNLPRVVPKGGLVLAGKWFPEGTIVGVNPWVAHINTSVFGPNADEFRPERWLEADQASANRMEQYFFTFGRGPRTCLGKSITLMEMMKIIPELVLKFDFSFAYPLREWSVKNDWFVKQEDFMVRVRERGGLGAGM